MAEEFLQHELGSSLRLPATKCCVEVRHAVIDLRIIHALIRHKDIQMIVRYSHLTPRHILAAVEKLTEAVSEAPAGTTTSIDATEQISADAAYVQ